jgi:DNA-binding MarR family transcriptional regulator
LYTLGYSFGYMLTGVQMQMNNLFSQKIIKYGITSPQWTVLVTLSAEGPGISPTELARAVRKDKPNTVRIIDKLAKKGLIHRQNSACDKRSYLIYLTAAGSSLREQIMPLSCAVSAQALTGFSSEEVENLIGAFTMISKNLE